MPVTQQKIKQRLQLIEPLIYRRRAALPSFKYKTLPDPVTAPEVGVKAADSGWQVTLAPAATGSTLNGDAALTGTASSTTAAYVARAASAP